MKRLFARLACAAMMITPGMAIADGVVNIYSYRQPSLIKPLLDAFTQKTGIETEVLFLDKGLEERIVAEGENSPADVILTVDISRLTGAVDAGITQPLKDEAINANIPASARDPEGHWFGLTYRGRVLYASKDRVDEKELSYMDLADPKYKGRICLRSGQHDYNIGLISAMIVHAGAQKAEEWLSGIRDNLTRKPDGNDRAQAKAVFSGECDLGIGNTYYVGLMMTNEKEPEQKDWAKAMNVIFPTFENGKTHVNVSGMAMAKHAPNAENALRLMEFLASDDGQKIYGEQVFEYPVNPDVDPSDIVKSFGTIHPDDISLAEIAKNRKAASEMVDRTGFNDGPQD